MIKVSVIMPVYNVEPYLRQCLDSVVNQTLKDIEVICVDDGSTDASLQILREYAAEDARMQVLTQQNQFAGVARNTGLEKAIGEYVIFWDADDYFALDALEKMYRYAKEKQADLCICDAQDFDSSTGKKMAHRYLRSPLPEKEVFNAYDLKKHIYDFTSTVVWNKLIRRGLLLEHGIRFQNLQHINDVMVSLLTLSCSERIVLLPEKLVFYRMNRAGSLMETYGNQTDAVFLSYEQTEKELRERGIFEDRELRISFLNKALGVYLFTIPYAGSYQKYEEFYRRMVEHSFPALGLDTLSVEDVYVGTLAEQFAELRELTPQEFLYRQYGRILQDRKRIAHDKNTWKRRTKKWEKVAKSQTEKLEQAEQLLKKQEQELARPLLGRILRRIIEKG